jgi:preprotein translocase subunit SecF
METIIFALVIIALAGVAIWYYNRNNPGADINGDGKVDFDDAKAAIQNTVDGVKIDARDARDLALKLTSESAGKTLNAVEKVTKSRRAKSTAKPTKTTTKTTTKPTAKKAPTKSRTRKST